MLFYVLFDIGMAVIMFAMGILFNAYRLNSASIQNAQVPRMSS